MSVSRLLLAGALALAASGAHAQVVLTGTPVQQNFDTLVNTGTGTAAQVPTGWAFLESNGNTSYTAADGTATSGDTYSVGSAGSTDRAFASIASNSNVSTLGAQLLNQTGAGVELTIAFTGEQWRTGGSGNVDRLAFAYSTDATGLGNGTWTTVPALDFVAPIQSGSAAALDGNLSANQAAVSHTIAGLTVGAGQTVWIRWSDPNIGGADDMLGLDNVVISTTGSVDLPPTVGSTIPASNAINVSPTANLSVQFSEAVTTNPGWFDLDCATTGNNLAVNESGTGSTRTLDPVPTLAFGEQCTATIIAASVIDLDGTPDPMASNYTWSFTVVTDNPPTVTSTSPANGVANVPVGANLLVNFSEPVTVAGSWFTIACANSGAHTAQVSGGPQSFTLNPDVNFDLLEACTVTLIATQITDLDGNPDALAANYVWSFTTAASSSNYYSSVDSSSAAQLRSTLHVLIDDHTAYRYSIGSNTCNVGSPNTAECDVWDIIEAADQDPGDANRVLDVYRNRRYVKITDRNSGTTSGTNYNREHSWPNSLGFPFSDTQGNDSNGNPVSPYTDGHMLFASASDFNQNRGNKPYDNCNAGCSENATDANYGVGGGTGVYPGNSNWVQGSDGNTGTYEVWNHRKGDMARAILYMDIRYEGGSHTNGQPEPDLIVTNNRNLIQNTPGGQVAATAYMGVLDTLIAWHFADPPDAQEILRNEVVYAFQGNRNPFIDHPEWVACLWQNTCTAGDDIFDNGFE